ncbi:hypothetical protein [Deefgea sp. CFH1-16]|uniref:hypothetical protein n=1 Tax=Deefgea sp. CFH1-16 TaxID=2675457 RepID=UPI0015F7742F|nr:hypothetical protein [Deefgea sp. CFH1-16]MBM5573233.1 hypothetical protein [Deefgea sp. CFH1-16]
MNITSTLPPLITLRDEVIILDGNNRTDETKKGKDGHDFIYASNQLNKAGDAMESLQTQIKSFKKNIEKTNPEMINKKWDFITENGSIKIISTDLKEKERSQLEEKINASSTIKSLADTINNGIAYNYSNTWYTGGDGSSKWYGNLHDKMDGQVKFMDFLEKIDKDKKTYVSTNQNYYREAMLLFSADYLTPEGINTTA